MGPVSETLYTARNSRDVHIHRHKEYYVKKTISKYVNLRVVENWGITSYLLFLP